MVLAGDVRPGTKVLYNQEPYSVVDVTFVKPGKGGAFARTKMKNLITSLVREVTFRTEEKLDQPDLAYRQVQYLYKEDNNYVFMDQENFEEVVIAGKQLEDLKGFIRDQEFYSLLFYNDNVIEITPPIHMTMEVVDTTPGVKGDTAQGSASKFATMDTGLVISVPLFVNIKDQIKIDTRNKEYIERMNKK